MDPLLIHLRSPVPPLGNERKTHIAMNKILFILAGSMLLLTPPPGEAQAPAPAEPKELAALRDRYQTDVQFALKPVQSRYAVQLQALVKTLTQKGDLIGALAVLEELKKQDPQAAAAVAPGAASVLATPGASPFSGTNWQNMVDNALSKQEFKVGGAFLDEYKGVKKSGRWKTTEDRRTVVVNRTDGTVLHYKMADDGNSCLCQEVNVTYLLTK